MVERHLVGTNLQPHQPSPVPYRKSIQWLWGDIFSLWNPEDIPRGGPADSLPKHNHAQKS